MARCANGARERRERERVRPKTRTGRCAVRLAAMALVTADAKEDLPASLDTVAVVRSVRLQADAWSRENDRRETYTCAKSQRHRDYLGCVTTSTSAGSPRLTTAMARLSAGARSAGFSIGPSACTPSPCAIFA